MTSAFNLNEAPFPNNVDHIDEEMEESGAIGDMEEGVHLFYFNQEPEETEHQTQPTSHQQSTNQEETEHQTHPTSHHQSSSIRLSSEDRMNILIWLLDKASGGHLQRGAIQAVAQQFHVSRRTIGGGHLQRGAIQAVAQQFHVSRRTIGGIWNTTKKQKQAGLNYNVSTKFQNRGRKRIQVDQSAIAAINMGDRTCLRDLASKLDLSKTTLHRMVKRGTIKPHTNPLHPGLKDSHKLARLKWILMLLQGATPESKREYYTMFDFVHLDEKWFYLTKKSHKCYIGQSEKGKYRAASSSKFMPKVMFTAVVARPRFNSEGHCTFDGKIGISPFTYTEPAKRSSINRPKGTLITKIVESVNKTVTRNMLINHIIPAIKAKWPADGGNKVIFIQQDNAKPHITQYDPQWQEVCIQDDFTFVLIQQPTNNPDLNILDLGFFRSIQSLMHKKMPKDVDAMLRAVNDAFYELEAKTLSNVWMSLQYVMNETLKARGGNDYDLPHVNKKNWKQRVI